MSWFGLRTRARYVNRGLVSRNSNTPYVRGFDFSFDTRLFGSAILPNVIACVGQACAQAVVNLPSGTITSPDSFTLTFCAILAPSIRCAQKVHFSMTPRMRTDTSGVFISFSHSHSSEGLLPDSGLLNHEMNSELPFGRLFIGFIGDS